MIGYDAVLSLDRQHIVDYATARYSTITGARRYGEYLRTLASLYGDGWYSDATGQALQLQ